MAYDNGEFQHWAKRSMREALRTARAYAYGSEIEFLADVQGAAFNQQRKIRILMQERAADYREVLIDRMRWRQGWTLAERVAGSRVS